MEFRILGPLEVVEAGQPVEIPPGKQRMLLAALLLSANQVVSAERLIDAIWGEAPPETAANALQVYVSQLRRRLEPARARRAQPGLLLTVPPGYLLRVSDRGLDLFEFERLAAAGRAALADQDFATAAERLREGLALWRGPSLADVPLEAAYGGESARLDDMRLAAVEDRLEAELALGRCGEHIPTLEALITENPLRERLRGQLMLALYRTGRQAEALAAFQATRDTLVEELGIEPSPALQRLERAILLQDAALEELAVPPRPALASAEPAGAPIATDTEEHEARRRITAAVWRVQVGGAAGTELDPEAVRGLGSRALAVVERANERHGAALELLDGLALRATYGIPRTNEDDALRALRAAAEASRELDVLARSLEREAGFKLAWRVGVETGSVLAVSDGAEIRRLLGAPVDTALELAHRAAPCEILIGVGTEGVVRHAARLTPSGNAWRLLEVYEAAPAIPRHETQALVGRDPELRDLLAAFKRASSERTCVVVTVLGAPGIGKTRLAAELRATLPAEARFLHGRCLPYGEGVTYSALREIVGQAVGDEVREAVAQALGDADDAAKVADRLAQTLEGGTATPEEAAWSTRRLFQALAEDRPLVVCFDDLHWAERTLLGVVEHVAQWAADAPILLVCLARPEFAESPLVQRPGVALLSLALEPLGAEESHALIDGLAAGERLAPDLRAQVAAAAEGNPLFIEQLLAALTEEGTGTPALPATIEALVAARLDLLDPNTRRVLECAAVVGRSFSRRAVFELCGDKLAPGLDVNLTTLLRRQLVASTGSTADEFRFSHEVIREVCYTTIPKARRARLHERFAEFVERDEGEIADPEAFAGHHLWEAHRFLSQAEPLAERLPVLAARAAELLEAAGRRAYASGNLPEATVRLGRAVELNHEDSHRARLLLALAGALRESGDFEGAREAVGEALRIARRIGDRRMERNADVLVVRLDLATQPDRAAPQALARVDHAIAELDALGDDQGLAEAWTTLAWIRWVGCRAGDTELALQRALLHARRAGDERSVALNLNLFLGAGLFGPTPVPQAIERCEHLLASDPGPRLEAATYRALGGLRSMQGAFDEARRLLERDEQIINELGLVLAASAAAETWGIVELLAGRPEEAERRLRTGIGILEPTGEISQLSTLEAVLAEAVYRQDRLEDAFELTRRAEEAAAPDDLTTQVQLRGVRAKVLSARGEADEAAELARAAADTAAETDFLNLRGQALVNLAAVWSTAGKSEEAASALERAALLFDEKGNVVACEQTRRLLRSQGAGVAPRAV